MGVGDAAAKLGAGVYAPEIERACNDWGITTPCQQAHFLAQVAIESTYFTRMVESLNYSAERVRAMFSQARISDADCKKLGRTKDHPADQVALANRLYGGLWGRNRLGNTEPGDGWLFRGRGMAQITGRDNYDRCGQALRIDLVGHPEMLVQAKWSAQSAGWYWHTHHCADAGDDCAKVTRLWNGGANGLADREIALAKAKHLLGVA